MGNGFKKTDNCSVIILEAVSSKSRRRQACDPSEVHRGKPGLLPFLFPAAPGLGKMQLKKYFFLSQKNLQQRWKWQKTMPLFNKQEHAMHVLFFYPSCSITNKESKVTSWGWKSDRSKKWRRSNLTFPFSLAIQQVHLSPCNPDRKDANL